MSTPTQVRFPWRATVRTFISTLPLTAAGITAFVDVVRDVKPEWVVGWGPAAAAASLIITRVMQNPTVNALLTRLGFGATPKETEQA